MSNNFSRIVRTTKISLIVLLIQILVIPHSQAQSIIKPGDKNLQQHWLKSSSFEMIWYAERDTQRIQLGTVVTQIQVKDEVSVITQVNLQGRNTQWVDTTVAAIKTLSPLYHSSYNSNRDMVLNFGKRVTGYYRDKVKGTKLEIADTTVINEYFDSNLYPHLLRLLPLKDGYTATIPIYDFNPNGIRGVVNAYVEKVESGTYLNARQKQVQVWRVTVSDELNPGTKSISTYFIGKEDRKLWKQEIVAGDRRMQFIAVE